MGPKIETNIKILNLLADLKNNWNGNEAAPPNQQLIRRCLKIVSNLNIQPMIFPTARESIQFEYENQDIYLELEIFEYSIECFLKTETEAKEWNYVWNEKYSLDIIKKINEDIENTFGRIENEKNIGN